MKTLELFFKVGQFVCLTLAGICVFAFVVSLFIRCGANKDYNRDYEYESYCDSIWANDPDYYLDVITESDEYIEYISINGEWWK